MTFQEYQEKAHSTAIYKAEVIDSKILKQMLYATLGLVGESGEFANKVKKIIRDYNGNITLEIVVQLHKELGDILWYASELAHLTGASLHYIAESNIMKLEQRKNEGKLKGEGDLR